MLRSRHRGGTILVHGNGPSCAQGYEFARSAFGDDLVIIGMNASPMIVTPDYYVVVDSRAMIRYVAHIDVARMRPVLAETAVGRIRRQYRRENPANYEKIREICRSPETIFLERKRSGFYGMSPDLTWIAGSNAGAASMQLALLMLFPGTEEKKETGAEAGSHGRLIVTGLDGYDFSGRFHINPESTGPKNAMEMNLHQNAMMAQVFMLAAYYGIELWNLSRPDLLLVNRYGRVASFDDRHFPESTRSGGAE